MSLFDKGFNNKGRTQNVIRNVNIALICQLISTLMGFVSRSVFVLMLGKTYLGVNGVFSNILTILNFAELGIGTAIVYNLYRPLKEHDEKAVGALLNFYKKAYFVIASVILGVGLALTPFLTYLISDQPDVKEHIALLYILYLTSTVVSYYNAHKKSLLNADQKQYVTNIYHQFAHIIQIVLQIAILIITRNYVLYLLTQILCMLLENYLVGRVANRLYPFLKLTKKEKISKSLLASIKKDVGALTVYQLHSAIIHGTDNIIITALEGDGVQKVGLYANYTLISETANTILGIITGVLTPSIGNLNVEEDNKKKESIFYTIMFVCAWTYGYACTGIFSLSEKFITQWLGAEFVFGSAIVFTIVLQLYVRGVHYAAFSYRVTCGLFVQSKYVPIFTSIINIGLSIYWGKLWGIFGILLASSVARVLTFGISDPVLVYKHIFKKSPIAYYFRYFLYGGIVVLCYFVSDFVTKYITIGGWLGFILSFVVYSVIFNGVFALCTFKTKSFEYLKNVFLSYFKKFLGKLAHR